MIRLEKFTTSIVVKVANHIKRLQTALGTGSLPIYAWRSVLGCRSSEKLEPHFKSEIQNIHARISNALPSSVATPDLPRED